MACIPESAKRGLEWWQIAVALAVALSWLGVSGVALLR
jgi:hypothetical protein